MTKQLHKFAVATRAYEDYQYKTDTVNLLRHLKVEALAGSAVAAYRLAKIYPKNSELFLNWMKKAIDQGLTNAMLDMAKSLAEKGSPTHLQQAASYVVRILHSNDSYIKAMTEDFLKDNQVLSNEVSRQINKRPSGLSLAGFFAHGARSTDVSLPLSDNKLQIN
ncbi:hypothetical protein [Legionella jamestowniensis]|uniref:Dot/Icm secretion system substrate n=1 Tax=Legionella jamestowniensis TaxID=455 RepID=A0A0W0UHM9_9GAMM|nr:hypothetical protein [Legionella jamestowniensis]KTD07364.1 hypothetical protein Ljam_1559 [Legionella jamestowniensis]OCH97861.1 hypothetical protein A8135_01160 [Legionella jamestowniensis]SFL94054.1 hypothetical protein SAMN02746073_2652 [Legionella jamestowniensis DSM 19215]